MEQMTPHKKLEPGIYQGTPNIPDSKKVASRPLMRTMKSDMDLAVKTQNETLVSIAIAEEKKQAKLRAESDSKTKQKADVSASAPRPHSRITVVIFVLLFINILVVLYIFLVPRLANINFPDISFPSFSTDREPSTDNAPVVISLAPSLIPAQFEKRIDISTFDTVMLATELQAEKNLGLEDGVIKNIYLTETQGAQASPISAKRLMALASISLPNILSRSLENNFMLGLRGEEGNTALPFLILKVSSRESSIAGMLEWEKNLPSFFNTLFEKNYLRDENPPLKFMDTVLAGRDARILNGVNTTVAYAFANPNTIIIATSKSVLEAILLAVGKAHLE